MKINRLLFFYLPFLAVTSCDSHKNNNQEGSPIKGGIHKIVVEEVIQAKEYTYLRAKENDESKWFATGKTPISEGLVYYFTNPGIVMNGFESKELKKTFDEIQMLDKISSTPDFTENKPTPLSPALTNAVVKEVLQTTKYTYLRVLGDAGEKWLALPSMQAKVDDAISYGGGLIMNDFQSKELKRTFSEVLFLSELGNTAKPGAIDSYTEPAPEAKTISQKQPIMKQEVAVSRNKDDVSISDLYKNKKSYSGKTVKVKGKVTKVTMGVMHKNWIHIQDGTENSGKFDLTLTTEENIKNGDIVRMEGKISLDKDFGYGYFYEVLMEDAKPVK